MNISKIRVATRGSQLAVTQTKQTVEHLKKAAPEVDFELVIIKTGGDKDHKTNLTAFGGVGIFVKELEEALLDGRADIAIHSLKDVPALVPTGLKLASFPMRADVHDVWISKQFGWPLSPEQMSPLRKITVGTGSPRRRLQLEATAPGCFEFKEIRGNIDTRLAKLDTNDYDVVILAAAGLKRLGVRPPEAVNIPLVNCLPAVGQGALAIESRSEDSEIIEVVRRINHSPTEIAVAAERSFMTVLEGGCRLPLACYAQTNERTMSLRAVAGDADKGQAVSLAMASTMDMNSATVAGEQLAITMRQAMDARGIEIPGAV